MCESVCDCNFSILVVDSSVDFVWSRFGLLIVKRIWFLVMVLLMLKKVLMILFGFGVNICISMFWLKLIDLIVCLMMWKVCDLVGVIWNEVVCLLLMMMVWLVILMLLDVVGVVWVECMWLVCVVSYVFLVRMVIVVMLVVILVSLVWIVIVEFYFICVGCLYFWLVGFLCNGVWCDVIVVDGNFVSKFNWC